MRYLHRRCKRNGSSRSTPSKFRRDGRPARVLVVLQATRVTLSLPVTRKRREPLESTPYSHANAMTPRPTALLVAAHDEPINTFAQICAIVEYPTLRWHVEELHRVWNQEGCNVEDMQLRSPREAMLNGLSFTAPWPLAASDSPANWLAATPSLPALGESDEIDAAIVLRRRRTAFETGRPAVGRRSRLHRRHRRIQVLGGPRTYRHRPRTRARHRYDRGPRFGLPRPRRILKCRDCSPPPNGVSLNPPRRLPEMFTCGA